MTRRGAVPVVVPHASADTASARQRPQLRSARRRSKAIDPVVVVARAGVEEREAVGVDGDRALDDVAGRERRDDVARRSRRRGSARPGRRRRTPPRCGPSRSNTAGWPVQPDAAPHAWSRCPPTTRRTCRRSRRGSVHSTAGVVGHGALCRSRCGSGCRGR